MMNIQKLYDWAKAEHEKACAEFLSLFAKRDIEDYDKLAKAKKAFSFILFGARLLLSDKHTGAITEAAHLANTVLGELPQVVSVENKESHQAVEGATQVVRQNEQRKKYCTYNGNCGFRGVKTIRCFYNAYCEFQSAIWASSPAPG